MIMSCEKWTLQHFVICSRSIFSGGYQQCESTQFLFRIVLSKTNILRRNHAVINQNSVIILAAKP